MAPPLQVGDLIFRGRHIIGETNYETFDQEHASKYLGLSSKAIKVIRQFSFGTPPYEEYPDEQLKSALESFIENPYLEKYLIGLCELAEAIERKQNPKDYYKIILAMIPEELRKAKVKNLSGCDSTKAQTPMQ